MTDFRILRTVWLHGRTFKPGQEAALEAAGFSGELRREQVRRGNVLETGEAPKPKKKRSRKADHQPDNEE